MEERALEPGGAVGLAWGPADPMSKHVERQKKLIEDAFAPALSDGEMLIRT